MMKIGSVLRKGTKPMWSRRGLHSARQPTSSRRSGTTLERKHHPRPSPARSSSVPLLPFSLSKAVTTFPPSCKTSNTGEKPPMECRLKPRWKLTHWAASCTRKLSCTNLHEQPWKNDPPSKSHCVVFSPCFMSKKQSTPAQ